MNTINFSLQERELVFDFFSFFARFEYALKNAGFLAGDMSEAKADWDKFENSIFGRFANISSADFQQAITYLETQPPQKQCVLNGQLDWKESKRGQGESIEKFITRLIRCTRNNLFHGGKSSNGPVAETARDQELLRWSLVILRECLTLNSQLESKFNKVD